MSIPYTEILSPAYPRQDIFQWKFQDRKMEVLYHIKAMLGGDIPLYSPYIGLIYGRYLQ